jgi:hypothetical protein
VWKTFLKNSVTTLLQCFAKMTEAVQQQCIYPTYWIMMAVFVHARNQHCCVTGGVAMMYLMALIHFKIKSKCCYFI